MLPGPTAARGDGRVRVLRPNERVASFVGAGESGGDMPLGALVRGMVTGDYGSYTRPMAAMNEGSGSAGGHLMPTPLAARIIDLARAQSVCIAAGAQTVLMDSATLKIARVEGSPGDSTGRKVENANAVVGDLIFGAVTLTARTLMVIAKMSIELAEDGVDPQGVIERELGRALAVELDRACLVGSGTPPEPGGISEFPGINTVALNDTPDSYAPFSWAVEAVRTDNHEPTAVIYSPRTAGTLDRLVDLQGQPLQPPASYADLAKFSTTSVPNDISGDQSVGIVGDFRQLLIGVRTNLVIEASRVAADGDGSAFRAGQVWVRAYLRADVAAEHDDAFALVTGIEADSGS